MNSKPPPGHCATLPVLTLASVNFAVPCVTWDWSAVSPSSRSSALIATVISSLSSTSITGSRGVLCPRCNGHGRPRIIALARGIRRFETIKGAITWPKKRKTEKTKIKRKRTAKKSKPEKGYNPKVDVLKPDVSDEALEREGALSFTRCGCP